MKLTAGSSRCAARLFLRRAHFNCSHRRLGISAAFINCVASQCYRSYAGDRSFIDDTTFLCREITHDIKFCGPNRRRKQQDRNCNQGPFHWDPTASVGAIQFYFRLAVHDRYYLMVCTARALKGAPVLIRLVSRFNRDKEHRDAASPASPRTKRSLFSSKAASLTNSKLGPGSEAVEAVGSHRSI
jgi:hypothetical protein